MRRRTWIGVAAALVFTLGGLGLAAQQGGSAQVPAFRSGVELVTIDVGVVDRQGKPMRGLGTADFIVTVAGQPRRVVTSEFVDVMAAQSAALAKPIGIPVSSNEGGGVGRLFAFVVDQGTLDTGNGRQVTRAASRFFSGLTFADRSALMVMPVGPNVEFTWAHDRVRDALQRVTGMGRQWIAWDQGSLSEARDISNRNGFALRTVVERECRSAGLGGGIDQGAGAGAGATPAAPTAPGGGSTPANPGSPTTTPSGGGGTGSTTTRGTRGGLGDACTSNLQMQADAAWRGAQVSSQSSLSALRQLIATLGRIPGDKTVILISGGWPLDEREEQSLIGTVALEAAAARATLFTLYVPGSTFSADRRGFSTTASRDQYLFSGPLETLAGMTGGGSFRAEVNAEAAFDRLSTELSGYYRISVEKEPVDQDGKKRRMKVQVTRSAATVRARDMFDVKAYEDRDWAARIASALDSPVPATSLGMRVASYLAPDPADRTRLKLVITGQASRLEPGDATFQVLLRDLNGTKILAGEHPLGESSGTDVLFSTNMSVPPGSYIARVAVMDSAGRVGSVDHRVEARWVPLGRISVTGPVLARVPRAAGAEPRLSLDSVGQDERLAFELGLEGDRESLMGSEVLIEIAASADGPALLHRPAALTQGAFEGTAAAHAAFDMRVLPPANYVARVKILSGLESQGEIRRAFTVVPATRVTAAATAAVTPDDATGVARRTAPAMSGSLPMGTIQFFSIEHVIAAPILGGFLDRVAARPDAAAPEVRDLVERARSSGVAGLQVPDAMVASVPVAAFLKGLALLSANQLDPAANAFREAMRGSIDFYPAMVYLGACYAAGGNDREAANAWRTALIKEGDAPALHLLLADALLRQGRADLALVDLETARARWPEDDGLTRRFAVASLLIGRPAEGLGGVDALMAKGTADEPLLALALLSLYDAFVNDRPVDGAGPDQARMIRLADAYRVKGGPSLALVNTWVATATRK